MRTTRHALLKTLLIGLIPLSLLTSCRKDSLDNDSIGGDGTEVTFSLQLPGKSTPSTRALSESDENTVESIDILAFEKETGGNGQYIYSARCSGDDIIPDGGDLRKKSFTATLRQGEFDLVIVANARSMTSAVTLTGKTKQEALQLLTTSVSGKWIANASATGYKAIPMWGNVGDVTINESTPINAVQLFRMIARVDVQVADTTTTSKFKLTSVRVYNYNTDGSIAPKSLTATDWDASVIAPKAVQPNVPTASTLTQGPLVYTGTLGEINAADNNCISEIYLLESENFSDAAHTTPKALTSRTCLVIGGEFDNGSETFYRVDFSIGSGASQSFLDVLRNHQYVFNITEVARAGYADAATAFNSAPAHIEVGVLVWNDANVSDIVFDGQYVLGLSEKKFDLSKDEDPYNRFAVTTNFGGWSASVESGSSWLSIVGNSSGVGTKDVLRTDILNFAVTENNSGIVRTGEITITSGRLTTKVAITQDILSRVDFDIVDLAGNPISELVFGAQGTATPDPKGFEIRWQPVSSLISVSNSLLPGIDPLTLIPSSLDALGSITAPNGDITYAAVQPEPFTQAEVDSFATKAIRFDYLANNKTSYMSKTLIISQLAYHLVYSKKEYYTLDGAIQSFSVRSNFPWTAEVYEDPQGVIQSLNTTFCDTPDYSASGTAVEFKTRTFANGSENMGTAKILIKSKSGEFEDVVVELFCAAVVDKAQSNCYMLQPGGEGVLIPVSQANRGWSTTNINATAVLTSDIIWSDNSTNVYVKVVGAGSSGKVLVVPKSQESNTVVSVKIGNVIKWSWHIWITDYAPVIPAGQLMTRNLGAFSDTWTGTPTTSTRNDKVMGLYYQWGRKDPFPPTNTPAVGTILDDNTSTGSCSVEFSAQNPLSFLTNWAAGSTNIFAGVNQLWNNNTTKPAYDPCPEGYRVPYKYYRNAARGLTANIAPYGYTLYFSVTPQRFMPAVGRRRNSDGALENASTRGYYWEAEQYQNAVAEHFGIAFTFTANSTTNSPDALTELVSRGHSVRCVAY